MNLQPRGDISGIAREALSPNESSVGGGHMGPEPGETTVGTVAPPQWWGRSQARDVGPGLLAARPATVTF